MRLVLTLVDRLPRLAWCARLKQAADTVEVFHGPWVETWPDRFFEGAWSGDFEQGAFADALVSCGSGGALHGDGILFCGPTHNWGRLHSFRSGDTLLVSNSLVFALEQSGESPDIAHARYFFDFLRFFRHGASVPTMPLPTAGGNPLHLHQWTNLYVGPDLSCRESPIDFGAPPAAFHDHERALRQGVSGVLRNAAAAGRRQRYRPLAMVSEGYDAPACAALAVQAGCTEGITLLGPPWRDGAREDGTRLGQMLGLRMECRDYAAFRTQPDVSEAELCAGVPFAPHSSWASFRDRLDGAILINGAGGDRVWAIDKSLRIPLGMSPPQPAIPGFSLAEFRLRVGLLSFPVPMIQSIYRHELFRVSQSAEMRPWRVGGGYDRPIPRRILEQAGIPRDAFGRAKRWAARRINEPEAMSEEGWRDFEAFYNDNVKPHAASRHGAAGPLLYALARAEGFLMRVLPQLPPPLYRLGVPLTARGYRDSRMPHWSSPFLYTFHWGVDRIRKRYAL